MAAFVPTGYLTFVKVLEVVGGVLVAVPRTRNVGLLVLGPILLNIVAFHVFVTRGEGLLNPRSSSWRCSHSTSFGWNGRHSQVC